MSTATDATAPIQDRNDAKGEYDIMPDLLILPRDPHEPARNWVYRLLLYNIVHLRLPPGSALVELEVRQRLGVSRTPMREAFMQLAQENFIQIVPQKGTYVSRIDMSQVLELRYIRRCTEAETARQAASGITEPIERQLLACLERQEEEAAKHDFEGFIDADDAMHRTIYAAAGKEGVWDFFSRTNLQHFRSRILGLRVGRTLTRLIGEHRKIVDALLAGDADKAESGVRTHLSDKAWNADSVQEKYPDYINLPKQW